MTTTTKFYTWDELWAELADHADVADEDFVDQAEAMNWANEAIDEAESLIHKTHEDYFISNDTLTLVSGTDTYAFPATIYAMKVVQIIYRNASRVYEVARSTNRRRFLQAKAAVVNGETSSNQDMQWFVTNVTPGSPKIQFTPPVNESGAYIEVWFYRQANRLASGSDIIDIPEFHSFVRNYVMERIQWKAAAGSPRHQMAVADRDTAKGDMVTTLQDMVLDEANEIEQDMSHYAEHN